LALLDNEVVADDSGCSCVDEVGEKMDGSEHVTDEDTSDAGARSSGMSVSGVMAVRGEISREREDLRGGGPCGIISSGLSRISSEPISIGRDSPAPKLD
jgi:hypothetical protein